MKALLTVGIILFFTLLYFNANTFPDYKLMSLFGFSFGINYNDYLLLKLSCMTWLLIYIYFKYIKPNGGAAS